MDTEQEFLCSCSDDDICIILDYSAILVRSDDLALGYHLHLQI
jgi:hypothetical protein